MKMNSYLLLSFWQEIIELKDFFIWPTLAGLTVGILAPLIGSVIVIRRLSFIADSLSHFSLAGITFGVLIAEILSKTVLAGFSPVLMGIIFSVAGTFLIEKLRGFYKNYKELSMPIVMSFGAALTGIFIALSHGSSSNMTDSLLFGSIFSVKFPDFIVVSIMAIGIFVFAGFYKRKIVSLCFDETFARVSGIKVRGLQLAITVILAIFISTTMQMFGVLLISALMIVPVASSILIGKSFKNTITIAVVFSEVSIILGIYFSYAFSLPSGSLIVIINILILVAVMIINHFAKLQKKKDIQETTPIVIQPNTVETDTSITITTLDLENISSDKKDEKNLQ